MEQANANQDAVVSACSFCSRNGSVYCLVSWPLSSMDMPTPLDRVARKDLTQTHYGYQRSEGLKVKKYVNKSIGAENKSPSLRQRVAKMISKAHGTKRSTEPSISAEPVSAMIMNENHDIN